MDLSPSTGLFADQLFRQIATADQANLLISPVGIFTILSMLLAGSGSNTKQQLTSVMRLPKNATSDTVDDYISRVLSSYEKLTDPANRLVMRNMLLASKGRTCGFRGILQSYEDKLIFQYRADLERVSFRRRSALIQQSVNTWVNQTTDGLVPMALSIAPRLDTNTMLIDVIHFSAQWAKAFEHSSETNFFVSKDITVTQAFMKLVAPLRYLRTPCKSDAHIQLIQVPYKDHFNMMIILPSVDSSLGEVLAKESLSELTSLLMTKGRAKKIELHMTKFKFTAKRTFRESLEQIGLSNLFNKPVDLSGINGMHNLRITSIEQVTSFVVSNEQVNASAAAVHPPMSRRKRKLIIINRPFAFVIYDTLNNLPVFMGKVVAP